MLFRVAIAMTIIAAVNQVQAAPQQPDASSPPVLLTAPFANGTNTTDEAPSPDTTALASPRPSATGSAAGCRANDASCYGSNLAPVEPCGTLVDWLRREGGARADEPAVGLWAWWHGRVRHGRGRRPCWRGGWRGRCWSMSGRDC